MAIIRALASPVAVNIIAARRHPERVDGVGVTCCKKHSPHVRVVLPKDRRRAEPAAPRGQCRTARCDGVHRGAVAELLPHRAIERGDDARRELPPPLGARIGRVDVPDRALRERAVLINRSWTAISGVCATSTSRCSLSRVMRRPSWNAMRNMAAVSRVTVNRNAPTNSSAVVIGPSLIGERIAAVVPVQWHVADRVRTAGVSPSKRRHKERNRHGCRVQADISASEPTPRHVARFSDDGEPAAAAPRS